MGAGDSPEGDVAAAAADLDRLVRRLRSLSGRAWEDRREPVQTALAGLVAIAAKIEGRSLRVPTVADHALADAVYVVGADVFDALARTSGVELLSELQALLNTVFAETR